MATAAAVARFYSRQMIRRDARGLAAWKAPIFLHTMQSTDEILILNSMPSLGLFCIFARINFIHYVSHSVCPPRGISVLLSFPASKQVRLPSPKRAAVNLRVPNESCNFVLWSITQLKGWEWLSGQVCRGLKAGRRRLPNCLIVSSQLRGMNKKLKM